MAKYIKTKDREHIIKLYLEVIGTIQNKTVEKRWSFICNELGGIESKHYGKAIDYLNTQYPTTRLNKEFRAHKYFNVCSDNTVPLGASWWSCTSGLLIPRYAEQRILFLKHLIEKLKKQ